jgi:hypothetical protein
MRLRLANKLEGPYPPSLNTDDDSRSPGERLDL